MTAVTRTHPSQDQKDQPEPTVRDWLVTYRIGIESTGRALLLGFHIEPQFTDEPNTSGSVAEFGDMESAVKVIRALRYPVTLGVIVTDWEKANDREVLRLCRRVADTGASANMLFWNPGSRAARAHLGQKPAPARSR